MPSLFSLWCLYLDPGIGMRAGKLLRNRAGNVGLEKVPKEDVWQRTIFCVLPGQIS